MPSFNAPPEVIARLLGQAPVVTRLALAATNKRLRDRAADDLADFIAVHADDPVRSDDPRQFALPLT